MWTQDLVFISQVLFKFSAYKRIVLLINLFNVFDLEKLFYSADICNMYTGIQKFAVCDIQVKLEISEYRARVQ